MCFTTLRRDGELLKNLVFLSILFSAFLANRYLLQTTFFPPWGIKRTVTNESHFRKKEWIDDVIDKLFKRINNVDAGGSLTSKIF